LKPEWGGGCNIGSRGEVPGETKPVIGGGGDDDDDDDNNSVVEVVNN
jgi:hypothetical protein